MKNKQHYGYTISIIVLFLVFICIYNTQIVYGFGDIPLHIKSALSKTGGYSLNTWVFYYLSRYTFADNMGIAIFLGIISLLTIVVSYYLLAYVERDSEIKMKKSILWIISCLIPFFGSVFIPGLYPYFYENTISPIVWHNSTVIEMKLFGMISLLYFFKMFYDHKTLKRSDWLIFTITLFLCNAFKPSYMLGFTPIAAIWFLMLLLRTKNFKKVMLIGIGIGISVSPMFFQWFELYGENGSNSDGGIAFVPGGRLLQTGNPVLKIICGLLFVIIMMLYSKKFFGSISDKIGKLSEIFWFINGMGVVNFFIYAFFLEISNAEAGNLAWGLKGILYFVYLFDIYVLLKAYKFYKKEVILISIIPFLQLISGIIYTVLLFVRHSFYF